MTLPTLSALEEMTLGAHRTLPDPSTVKSRSFTWAQCPPSQHCHFVLCLVGREGPGTSEGFRVALPLLTAAQCQSGSGTHDHCRTVMSLLPWSQSVLYSQLVMDILLSTLWFSLTFYGLFFTACKEGWKYSYVCFTDEETDAPKVKWFACNHSSQWQSCHLNQLLSFQIYILPW